MLKPGGRYLFTEHTRAPEDWRLLNAAQTVMDPLQNALANGCHLRRDPRPTIERVFGEERVNIFCTKWLPASSYHSRFSPRAVVRALCTQRAVAAVAAANQLAPHLVHAWRGCNTICAVHAPPVSRRWRPATRKWPAIGALGIWYDKSVWASPGTSTASASSTAFALRPRPLVQGKGEVENVGRRLCVPGQRRGGRCRTTRRRRGPWPRRRPAATTRRRTSRPSQRTGGSRARRRSAAATPRE